MRHPSWSLLLLLSLIATSTVSAQAPQAPATPQARLLTALQANRLPLTMSDGRPAGPGWDWLVREAGNARFTLIGEEHGVAETAQLAAALFKALRESGYSRFAIELSPPIAQDIEAAARRNGVQGIEQLLSTPGIFTFFNLHEEAQFVADVVAAAPKNERVVWGFDREIFSDRYLISKLEPKVPAGARAAFARLKQASSDAQAQNARTGNPDDLFFLSQDSALASALRAAWPNPDPESDAVLRTLEASLAIETVERSGGAWPYMQRRAAWGRTNFAALLRTGSPKLLMKFGYNHMIRGANYFNFFDLGTMADEVAALTGEHAFHILVLPGPGSRQATLGGAGFGSVASDSVDEMRAGDQRLTRVLSNPNATGHEVLDLRPLRALTMRGLESWNADVVKTIIGYDAVVIWKGAHASTGLK
jgi:erythromycin esterase-like protein